MDVMQWILVLWGVAVLAVMAWALMDDGGDVDSYWEDEEEQARSEYRSDRTDRE